MIPSKRKKILVVEDEEDEQAMLKRALEQVGYIVVVCQAGQEALTHAELYRPDLILLDVMLDQDMDGFEVLARLRASEVTALIPVIIVSALCDVARTTQARVSGAVDCIAKPYDLGALYLRVERALQEKDAAGD